MLPSSCSNPAKKLFVFDNEVSFDSQNVEEYIDPTALAVDISGVIAKFERACGPNATYSYRVFEPSPNQESRSCYVQLPADRVLTQRYFMTPIIMIKYSRAAEDEPESSSSAQSGESRKERNKERTVREVVESVKRWRDLHDSSSVERRVSLQEAAKVVGISKKSLDDYFFQLRVGEQHGFDFEKHLDSKVGVLRAFNRQHKPAKETLKDRHSHRLKIMEDVGFSSGCGKVTADQLTGITLNEMEMEPAEAQTQAAEGESGSKKDTGPAEHDKMLAEYEEQFYRSFEFDDPYEDMFATFKEQDFADTDFQKKSPDFEDLDLMPW